MVFGDRKELCLHFVSLSFKTFEQRVHRLGIPRKLFGNTFASELSFKDRPVSVNGDKCEFEVILRPIQFGNVIIELREYFQFHRRGAENFFLEHKKQVRGFKVTRGLKV